MKLLNYKSVLLVCTLGIFTSTGCLSELGLVSEAENQGDTSGSELEQAQTQLMENEAKLKAAEEQLEAAKKALGDMQVQLHGQAPLDATAGTAEAIPTEDEATKPNSSQKESNKENPASRQDAQAASTAETASPNSNTAATTATTNTNAQPTNLRPPSGTPSLLGSAGARTNATTTPAAPESTSSPSSPAAASQPASTGTATAPATATNTPAATSTPTPAPSATAPATTAPATTAPATTAPAATAPATETPAAPTPPKRRTNLFGKSKLLKSGGKPGDSRRNRTGETPSRPSSD